MIMINNVLCIKAFELRFWKSRKNENILGYDTASYRPTYWSMNQHVPGLNI